MILSCLRVIFMELKNFKQRAVLEVQKQALNHVFYAENIKNNLLNVREFEEKYQISMLSTEQVLDYWNQLVREQRFGELVALNAEQYLNFVLNIQDRNFLRNSLRVMDITSSMEDFWITRLNQCTGFFEMIKAMMEQKQVTFEKGQQFITSQFSFTSLVMEQTDSSIGSLLLNEQFLRYCHYSLKNDSSLLQEDSFAKQLLFLLRLNGMHENYSYVFDENPTLKGNFFEVNRSLARKIYDNFSE